MKRFHFLLVITILMIVFSGCGKNDTRINIKNADNISIFLGARSYAMFSTNEDTIKKVSEYLNSLRLEETEKQMDVLSMFTINFSIGEENTQVCVDKKGVFRLDDSTECFELESDTFDYAFINDIYKKGK